jgi:hypothetical protein
VSVQKPWIITLEGDSVVIRRRGKPGRIRIDAEDKHFVVGVYEDLDFGEKEPELNTSITIEYSELEVLRDEDHKSTGA